MKPVPTSHSARRGLLLLFAPTFTLMIPAATRAQIASPIAGEVEGDIVVTARKTNERLQDVPISINAVTGAQLRERGAVDVKDVLRSIPGFSFSGVERGLSNYNIRGVSTVASSPTVGIYLDDISLVTVATSFSGAFDPVFFDMERLEVLKGPQGTLYGGSSMGGAIKYVSARPDLARVGGSAAAGIATTAHGDASYNTEVVINLPIVTDKLAVRVGGYYHHDGGYIDNVPALTVLNPNRSSTASPVYTPFAFNSLSTRAEDDQNSGNTYVGRVSLLWRPDPSWTILPAVYYQDYKLANPSQFFINEPKLTSSYRIAQPTHDRAGIYSLDVEKDLGPVRVTSLTAYFDRKVDFTRDYSFFIGGLVVPLATNTSTNLSASRTKTFSEEFRLSSNTSPASQLQWVVGLYYSHQKDNLYQIVTTPGATPVLGTEVGYLGDTTTQIDQYAAFGEGSYELFRGFSVTAGARLFQIKQRLDLLGNGPLNGGLTQTVGQRSNEKGFNPKLGVSYKLDQSELIYASAAKGFRPGGPNRFKVNPTLCAADLARLGLTSAPDTFKSDNLWSYELGTKNQFAGNRIMVNGAAFYTDWKKIQQSISLTNCGFAFTGNAGNAHIKGAEIEGRINLTRIFQVGGTGTYTDAKIVGAAAGTAALDGDEVQAVPKWMASAYASASLPLNARWGLQLRAEYQYQSEARRQFGSVQAVTFANAVRGTIPNAAEFRESYSVVNAFATLSNMPTEIRLYMNNLFDARPYIDTDLGIGSARSTTIRPRTIGVEVRRRF